jgi:hypothetical protein
MNIPPIWTEGHYQNTDRNGRSHTFAAYGWSFESLEDARRCAVARAKRIYNYIVVDMAADGSLDEYEYADGPIREEIVHKLMGDDGLIAVVTRNRYGALILNTADVCFVDVDFPPVRGDGFFDSIKLAFSPLRRDARRDALRQQTVDRMQDWAADNPGRGFRLYRTPEGLRLLFTDRLYDPAADETAQLFGQFGADPLYVRLTKRQECFRARVTAKPWRCGCPKPPGTFPWENAAAEESYRHWERQYTEINDRYRACELLSVFGTIADIESLRTVIEYHDRQARVKSGAALA